MRFPMYVVFSFSFLPIHVDFSRREYSTTTFDERQTDREH